MHRKPRSARRRTGYTAFLAAIIAAVALAGVAIAKSTTLSVFKNGTVSNQMGMTKTEPIAVNSKDHAVYLLTGDSKTHPECTAANGCLAIWLPVTVNSSNSKPSAAKGIKGKLSVWNRTGLTGPIHQVTLGGHPLYTFLPDTKKADATGEGIVHFGGTWHVIKATVSHAAAKKTTPSPPPMMNPPSGLPPY
jgi:predicted lipoprotein with Yx(FWY)xxD motif